MARTLHQLEEAFGSDPFTAAQAIVLGISRRRLASASARGELQRLRHGVYQLPSDRTDPRQLHLDSLTALLLRLPGAVAAGVSAAALWGLPCPDTWEDWRNLPVTVWSPRRIDPPRGVVCLRGLTPRGHQTIDSTPVTDLISTARDVAWQLPTPQALIVVDAVARRLAGTNDKHRLVGPRLRGRVQRQLGIDLPPAPGVRRMRQALQWADPAADSAPESYLRGHILQAGVSAPSVNHPLTGASGKRYWVDLYWPNRGRAIEIDGRQKYTEPGTLYREKIREDDLRAAGIHLTRLLAADVFAHAPALARKFGAH